MNQCRGCSNHSHNCNPNRNSEHHQARLAHPFRLTQLKKLAVKWVIATTGTGSPWTKRRRCTVFDTGKHGVGGRMATRISGEPSLRSGTGSLAKPAVQLGGLRFDHAAQFFTVTGAPRVAQQLMRLRLNAVWALMVAFDGPLPVPFEGAFIQGSPILSWAGNNTAKMGLRHTPSDIQCWTLFSTNAYGQANKVPQEAIPAEVADKVAEEMLAAFKQAVTGPGASRSVKEWPRPVFTRVGVCGDWLTGGSLQAAAVSGITLARKIAGCFPSLGQVEGRISQGAYNQAGKKGCDLAGPTFCVAAKCRSVAYLGNAVGLPAAPGLGLMDPDHVLHRIFAYDPPALDSLWDAVRAGKTWSGLVCMPSHLDLRGLRDAASAAAMSTSPCAGQRALSAAADATAAVVPESMPWSQGLLYGGGGSGGVGGGAAADTDVVGLLLQQLQQHGSGTGSRVGGGATAATATCASAAAVAVPVGSGRGVGERSTAVVTAAAAGCGSGDSGGGGGGGSWGFGWVSHLPSASLPSPQAPPAERITSAAGSLSPDVVATITGPPPPRATAATAGGSSGGGCNNSGSRGKPVMKLPRNVSAPTFRSVASSSRPLPSVLEAEASCGGSVCRRSGSAAAVSVATLLAHRASWNADQTFPAQAGTSLYGSSPLTMPSRQLSTSVSLPNAQSALGSSYSHSHSVTSPSTPSCGGFGALSGAQQYMARSVAYLGNAVGLPAAPGLGLMDPDHVLHRIFAYDPPALDSLWDAVRAGKTWSGLVCMPSHLDLRGLRDAASAAAMSTSPCAGQRALSAAADATAAVVPESMPWSQGLLYGGGGSGGVGGGAAADTDVVGLLLQQLQQHGSGTGSRVGGGATAATATCASAAAVAVPVGSGRGVGERSTAVVTAAAAGCGSGDSGGGGGGGSWGFGWVSHLPSASLPSPQAPPAERITSAAGSLSPDVVATITGPPPPRATAATAGGSSGGGCNNSGSRGKPVMKLPRNVSAPTFRSVASSSRPLPSVLEAEASCGGSVCRRSGSAAAVSVATLLAHRASWNADQTFPAQAGTSLYGSSPLTMPSRQLSTSVSVGSGAAGGGGGGSAGLFGPLGLIHSPSSAQLSYWANSRRTLIHRSNSLAQTEYALDGSYRTMGIAASAASQGLLGQGPTTAFAGGGGGWSYGSADGLQCCSPRGLDASLADQLSGPKFVPALVASTAAAAAPAATAARRVLSASVMSVRASCGGGGGGGGGGGLRGFSASSGATTSLATAGEELAHTEATAAAAAPSLLLPSASPPYVSNCCWHEVQANLVLDPVSTEWNLVLAFHDVTSYVQAELEVRQVLDAEHRILEEVFPRHVLEVMTSDKRRTSAFGGGGGGCPSLHRILEEVFPRHVLEVMTSDKRRTSAFGGGGGGCPSLVRTSSLSSTYTVSGGAAATAGRQLSCGGRGVGQPAPALAWRRITTAPAQPMECTTVATIVQASAASVIKFMCHAKTSGAHKLRATTELVAIRRSVAYLGNAVGLPAAPGLGLMDPDHVLHRIFAYDPPALDSLWDAVRAGKTWSGLVCMPSHLDLRGLRDAASAAAMSTSPCAGQRALSAAADATAAVVPESMPWSQGLLYGGGGSGGVGGGAAADTDVVGLLLQQLQQHGSGTGSRVGGGATAATATCASAAAVAVPVGSGRGCLLIGGRQSKSGIRHPADGEAADGEAANGEAANGEAADSEAADGEAADAADGEAADGEAADGEAADGEAADGEAADGEAADGEAADGEAADGEAADGEAAGDEAADGKAADGEAADGEMLAARRPTVVAILRALAQDAKAQAFAAASCRSVVHERAYISQGLAESVASHPLSDMGGASMALAAHAQDQTLSPDARRQDIWDDEITICLLRSGECPPGTDLAEQKRCAQRARKYRFQGETLCRIENDGKPRVVPKPGDRTDIIKRTHEQAGHFGVRRTTALLLTSYWWQGMHDDVASVVRHCAACDRVNTSFSARALELNPLPISGLFYRWGVDLCGPFKKTPRGFTYVMICVEHFSKYVVLIPLPDKHAEQTAFAFQHHILGRYGACAEVCTDQGSEWKAEFAQLLIDSLIDHRQTSANHPQANGLAERAVQTCKNALRRIAHAGGGVEEWDKHLPYVMLGYNCSVQSASRVTPYHVMHAVEPTIPPAIKQRFESDVSLDDPEAAARSIMQRAAALRRHMAVAGGNLLIAQHRDTLQYARMRGGAVLPRLRRFEMGDYVYYRNTSARASLDPHAKPDILRVTELPNAQSALGSSYSHSHSVTSPSTPSCGGFGALSGAQQYMAR
ncbi:hypothetical protein VOLCADRAFT_117582 [Volvox carteri f. nagariensis]|uniref:Integrase zinc-binding domain-containing protein n=1 Tax=Volvox carteri f. nagariensis TaxID=3068 RepID=D8TVC0_VOLCA|nr:uncharacterized protein VOLCADRAFT_117582 [Volvox carteri f. nagariensis]EFJ48675.1 hypothetical protein VOLCADRAFT_117582 [Volvox carteri f. nagariensis]|eukprot:XP_002950474.1 hypothetical protein VOLCADRAFT_117582 [Volvox carteri f. nagariensis]